MAYNWKDRIPLHIEEKDLTDDERYKLIESEVFCILPWIHMSIEPSGKILPCCISKGPVGSSKEKSLKEIWNDNPMRELRRALLADQRAPGCRDCYEHESVGTKSLRNGCNKAYGHLIKKANFTDPGGALSEMKLYYWDIRFSNICNLKCRMCSSSYSSRWQEDEAKIYGKHNTVTIQHAGRHEDDIWEQLQEHLPYVESIYFAGGEPLLMEEHYRILKSLIDLGNTKVHLTYATNLTKLEFKNQSILDLWKHFPKVGVNASLDDMGERAAVIRTITDWTQIEQNLRDLKSKCPHIYFTVGPTVTAMNIWNICRFHRHLVDQGLILAEEFNINILQAPSEFRIDILPMNIKQQLQQEIEQHLEWLRPLDPVQRATTGFESMINFMMATDNSSQIPKFWDKVESIDEIRSERLLDAVPELQALTQYR